MSGFYDLQLSISVLLLYQVATFLGYGIFAALFFGKRANWRSGVGVSPVFAVTLSLASLLFFVIFRVIGAGQSLTFLVAPISFWALSAAGESLDKKTFWSWVCLVLVILLTISVIFNQRTYVFMGVLFAAILFASRTRKLLTVSNIFVGGAAIISVNVISSTLVEVRPTDRQQMTFGSTAEAALDNLARLDTWINALPFSSVPDSQNHIDIKSRYFSPFLIGGDDAKLDHGADLTARFAQLGHLDIPVGRQSLLTGVDSTAWRDMLKFFTPGAKSSGEQAVLYSDEVIWDLGLRDRGNVGRPLISVAGELYLMFGIFLFPVVTFLLSFAISAELHVLSLAARYSDSYFAGGLALLFASTFTGTALNIVGLALFGVPLTAICLWVLRRVGARN